MPNEQNPYKQGVQSVLNVTGYSNNEKFVVGPGGQTVFNVAKEIGGGFTVFEDGVITNKTVNKTGISQITTALIPEGTVVNIIY